jgi:hypothetical protein
MFPDIFRYSNKMILIGLQLKPLLYLFKLANYVPNLAKRQALSARTLYIKITKGYTLQHGTEKIYYRLVKK